MKKMIQFNLLLTVLSVAFVFIAAISPSPKYAVIIEYLADPEHCCRYYEVRLEVIQTPCNKSCPPNCDQNHFTTLELSRIRCDCPQNLRFNPEYKVCDFPWTVTCYHAQECTRAY